MVTPSREPQAFANTDQPVGEIRHRQLLDGTAHTCRWCGTTFRGRPVARYCSGRCRTAHYRDRIGGSPMRIDLDTTPGATAGTVAS